MAQAGLRRQSQAGVAGRSRHAFELTSGFIRFTQGEHYTAVNQCVKLGSTMTTSPTKTLQPLKGVRVLSLSLNLPGPAALMRCRKLGATCVKLEPPAPAGA